MKRDLTLSIFFPAYNEEDNIAASVRAAEKVARSLTDTYEIIIVDDGSSDKTGDIADRMSQENPRIRAVHHYSNMGYGAAVWSGIQAARHDWVFFTDGDLQFRIEELVNLADFIPDYRVVLGYRAPRRDPFMRLVNAWGWNRLNRFLFGLRVRDVDCAFKLFDRRLVAGLPVKSRGAMMSAELLIRLQRMGVAWKEVPVTHLPRVMGSPTGAKPSVIIRAFRELYSLWRSEPALAGDTLSTYMQLFAFGMIGLVNTFVDIAAYYGMTRATTFFAAHLVTAKVLSFALGAASSFLLNRRFTFGLTSRITAREVVRFYSTVGAGVLINAGALYIFHHGFNMHDLIAVGIATILTFLWGFMFSKFWVFAEPKEKKTALEGAVS